MDSFQKQTLINPPGCCPACGAKRNGPADNDDNVVTYQCYAVFVREIFDDPKSEYKLHIGNYCKNAFDVAVKLREENKVLRSQIEDMNVKPWC